jgi:nicotinamide-nucleotide amidase
VTGRAALVLVGDELLGGSRRDENGVWLLARLAALGVPVTAVLVVGDEEEAIAVAVRHAAARADLVIVGGGLGPTADDRTAAALAPLADGAQELPNPAGRASGVCFELEGAQVLVFPGVPREWRAFCELHVLDPLGQGVGVARAAVWTAGLREAEVAARVESLPALEAVELGSYPHDGEVELEVRARGAGAAEVVAAARAALLHALGPDAFEPPPDGRLQHVVVDALARRGLTLATAESVTGGLVAHLLTGVPGASRVYPLGWVTYATAQKTARLGVSAALLEEHGVVSEAVARAMAEGARSRAGTHAALATTGAAGPDPLLEPGRPPVAPGRVHVALALEGRPTQALALDLPGPRALVQRLAAVRALDLLRRSI